jgi:hypothetical protein
MATKDERGNIKRVLPLIIESWICCLASLTARSAFSTDPFFPIQKTLPVGEFRPFICREGCKHYDGVTDARDGIFKEFCCYGRSYLIKGSSSCDHFEEKDTVHDDQDGILRF